MTLKSPDQNLLEAHSLNRWAAKNPDQLLSALTTSASSEDNSETSQAAELESVEDLETKLGPIQQNLVQLSSFKDIVSDQLNILQTDVSVLKKDITQRKNAGDNSEFQSIENGTTGNARMDDEAPDTHLSGPPDIKQPPKEIADMITDLETRLESKFTNNEQNLSNLEEKINNLKDQQFKDLEHKIEKQVQTSLTKTNVDIRSLEQKVTENINNITNLQTKVQGTEKEKISKFEAILRKHSEKIGIIMCLLYQVPQPNHEMDFDLGHIHTLQDFLFELRSWEINFFDHDDYMKCKHFSE